MNGRARHHAPVPARSARARQSQRYCRHLRECGKGSRNVLARGPGDRGIFPVAHIHERIDFTVAIFVVHAERVLLIHHRKLGKWLPLGGHIELDEDPEQAALRETREESGLEVRLVGERPPTTEPGTRALIAPRFLDIHRIHPTHDHIGMIYFARPVLAQGTAEPRLATEEHHEIRWVCAAEFSELQPPLSGAIRWYCEQALQELRA